MPNDDISIPTPPFRVEAPYRYNRPPRAGNPFKTAMIVVAAILYLGVTGSAGLFIWETNRRTEMLYGKLESMVATYDAATSTLVGIGRDR